MAVDIIARGMTGSLLDKNGKLKGSKLPSMPSEAVAYQLGGIPAGVDLTGMSLEDVLVMMLYGVIKPTLTAPSFSAVATPDVGSVGQSLEISGSMSFDRGSISPANGTSGFRAGAPISYTVNDQIIETSDTEVNFTYTIDKIVAGENEVVITVNYGEGEQPLDSAGNAFEAPYPAGNLTYVFIVNGLYSIYVKDTTGDGSYIESHAHVSYFEDEEGEGYMVSFDEELDEHKQTVLIADGITVVGIKQFNIRTQNYEWLYGDAESSLAAFTTSVIPAEELGADVDYVAYTNALGATGERSMRFYISLKES